MFAFQDAYLPAAASLTGLLLRHSCPSEVTVLPTALGLSMTSPLSNKASTPEAPRVGDGPASEAHWTLGFRPLPRESGVRGSKGLANVLFSRLGLRVEVIKMGMGGLASAGNCGLPESDSGPGVKVFPGRASVLGPLPGPRLLYEIPPLLSPLLLVMKYQTTTAEGSKEGLVVLTQG